MALKVLRTTLSFGIIIKVCCDDKTEKKFGGQIWTSGESFNLAVTFYVLS